MNVRRLLRACLYGEKLTLTGGLINSTLQCFLTSVQIPGLLGASRAAILFCVAFLHYGCFMMVFVFAVEAVHGDSIVKDVFLSGAMSFARQ